MAIPENNNDPVTPEFWLKKAAEEGYAPRLIAYANLALAAAVNQARKSGLPITVGLGSIGHE